VDPGAFGRKGGIKAPCQRGGRIIRHWLGLGQSALVEDLNRMVALISIAIEHAGGTPGGSSLRHGHQLENVAVEILEVEAPAPFQSLSLASSRLQGVLPKASPAACTRCRTASNSASLTWNA
jgi:hypothetical protein